MIGIEKDLIYLEKKFHGVMHLDSEKKIIKPVRIVYNHCVTLKPYVVT